MKKLLIAILFISCIHSLKAQDAFFSLYRQNNLWSNPAYAGVMDKHVFSLSGRTQWGYTYNTAILTYDQPIRKINSGIGVILLFDQAGTSKLTNYYAGLCYKYNFKLAEEMNLGVGVNIAFVHRTLDLSNLYFANQFTGSGFSSTPNGDLIINSEINYIDFGAGIWYSWKDFNLGFSVKHINRPDISFDSYGKPDNLYQAIIATGSYTWKLSKHFSTIPSAIFIHQGPSNYLEIDDEFCLDETYYLGIGYRPTTDYNSLKISGGINLKKKFQLMAGYDFNPPWETSLIDGHGLEVNIKYLIK